MTSLRKCEIVVGKSKEKRPLGTSRRKWDDNIRMNLTVIVYGCELDSTGSG
jgi:hypothetical protein